MPQRVAGLIQLAVNGQVFMAKGEFSWNLGHPKRNAIIGTSGVHGYAEEAQVAYIEGEITDPGTVDLAALQTLNNATVQLNLGNGKGIVLSEAWYAADGVGSSGESNFEFRFESGSQGQEIAL